PGASCATASSATSVQVRGLAEGVVGEVVVGAVGAEWVHEGAGFDVAVGAGEGAGVDVARAAGEREGAFDDSGGGGVCECFGGLGFGEQGGQRFGGAVGVGVGGSVLVDQVCGAR